VSNAVFPAAVRGLTWTILKSFEFDTIVQSSPAKIETRVNQMQNPVWHLTFIYDYLKDYAWDIVPGLNYTDYQTMLGFCLARQGKFDDFLYDDTSDNSVGPGLLPSGDPNPQAQLQLIQDSSTGIWYSPIQRNMGGQFYEDITDLQAGGITVYGNGAVQIPVTQYNVGGPGLSIPGYSFFGLYIQWTGTPTPPITAQFNFYFRMRFEEDTQDFENFMYLLWTIGGESSKNGSGMLKLVSARTAAI
jgi:hypothetical protein